MKVCTCAVSDVFLVALEPKHIFAVFTAVVKELLLRLCRSNRKTHKNMCVCVCVRVCVCVCVGGWK